MSGTTAVRSREYTDVGSHTCEKLYTLRLVLTDWTLYKTPRIIEFCLSGDMRLLHLLYVLRT
jgi:hypothetical protein